MESEDQRKLYAQQASGQGGYGMTNPELATIFQVQSILYNIIQQEAAQAMGGYSMPSSMLMGHPAAAAAMVIPKWKFIKH